LNRDLGRKRYGDAGYAMEELVAEIGAAFLCSDLGITPEIREDHAGYIASWLTVLKNDTRDLRRRQPRAESRGFSQEPTAADRRTRRAARRVNLALPATRPPNKTEDAGMRAIVIKSWNRTVVEIDLVPTLDRLQQIVGGLIEPVEQGLDDEHHCYVNEEGLLDNPQHFFMLTDGHQPLAGNGIILASTEDGDEAPCRLPLEWVKERVTFMDFYAVRRWCQDHDQGESAPDQLEPNP
jgi:hypothetical protein